MIKTAFSRNTGAFATSLAPMMNAGLSQANSLTSGRFGASLTSVRHFQDLRSLRIPGPLPDQEIDFYGRTALNKVSLSAEAFEASAAGWEAGIAALNTSAARDKLPLSRQFKLTRTDSVALALAVIQAGNRLSQDIDSTSVVSVIYNLLASLPVRPELLARFERYAQQLVKDIIPHSHLLSESLNWPDVAPSVRLEVMRDLFRNMYPLAQALDLAPSSRETVSLNWDGDVYDSPIAAGFFLIATDARGLQRDPGHVRLSRHLIEADFSTFALGSANRQELTIVAPALSIAMLSHEIFHAWQFSHLDILTDQALPTATAVKYATSIGCQSVIATKSLGTTLADGDSSETRLLPHFPHEKEAWALTFMVVRAMYNSTNVPERYKSGLKNYLINNFDVFVRCFGGAHAPRPVLSSGELWNSSGDLCIEPLAFDDAQKKGDVAEFLAHRAAQPMK